jgi:hypothetical protein
MASVNMWRAMVIAGNHMSRAGLGAENLYHNAQINLTGRVYNHLVVFELRPRIPR